MMARLGSRGRKSSGTSGAAMDQRRGNKSKVGIFLFVFAVVIHKTSLILIEI